jgi:hypothetical protein
MNRLLLLAFCAAIVFAVHPAGAQSEGLSIVGDGPPVRSVPGEGGEPHLPAGFQETRWGATVEILQVTRGPMERRPSPKPDIELLIEAPAPGEPADDIVHYKLWRDQLMELRIFYQDALVGVEAHDFLGRIQGAYGDGNHSSKRGPAKNSGLEGELLEESWAWEDPFTTQVLIRDPRTNEWSLLRRSRVLEEIRAATEERELNRSRDDRVNSMPID